VKGPTFYSDHRLFQRLYESVQAQVDTLAEKMVGAYGEDAVDGMDVGAKFESWVRRWNQVDCLHKRGLLSEQDFQSTCLKVYESLGQSGDLSLGMDDFLMATANEHETNEYLLRQLLRSVESAKTAAADWTALSSQE
jgi:DNA-binding ferritin-like protein